MGDNISGIKDDRLIEEARGLVISYQRASASLLQRKLKIGYARAALLLDYLEDEKVIEIYKADVRKVLIKN